MNDFTPIKTQKDKVVIVDQKQQEKQEKLIAQIRPKRGHTVFEVNLKERNIGTAQFEESVANFERESHKAKSRGLGVMEMKNGHKKLVLDRIEAPHKKLIKQPNCVYISALNKQNSVKKLVKLGVIKILNK